jgi:hypothetical protein
LLQPDQAHVPVAQVPVPLAMVQGTPHPPQSVTVLVAVSQPSVSLVELEQLAKPGAHAD